MLLMAGLVVFAVTVTSFAPVTVSVLPKAMPPLLVIFTLPEQSIFVGLPQAGEPEFAVTVTSCAPVTVSGPGTTMPVPSLVSVTLPEQVISVTPAIAGLLTFEVTVTSCAPVTVSALPNAMPPLLVIFTLPEQLIFAAKPEPYSPEIAGEPEFVVTVTSFASWTVSVLPVNIPVSSLVSVTLPEQVISTAAGTVGP